jgi:hypothetical protein
VSEAMRKQGAEMGYSIPDVIVDGEVIEANPPHKLLQTTYAHLSARVRSRRSSRLTMTSSPGTLASTARWSART